MPTAEKVKTYRLIARGRNERLIRQPLNHLITATGSKHRVSERFVLDFAPDGILELREGQDMLADGPLDPETGQPTMQDALSWLTKGYQYPNGDFGPHPLFNQRVWIEGLEPDRPRPTESEFLDVVTDALGALDPEPLRALLETERATHNRAVLVKVAEDTLGKIEATQAVIAAQAPQEPPPA